MTNTDERSVKAEVNHSLYLTILFSSHFCYELGILKSISFYPEAWGILPHEVGQSGQSHTQACFRGSSCHWLKISLRCKIYSRNRSCHFLDILLINPHRTLGQICIIISSISLTNWSVIPQRCRKKKIGYWYEKYKICKKPIGILNLLWKES